MGELRKFVILRRVSTREQGRSGLGLEAQQRDVALYLSSLDKDSWEVVADLVEVGTGGGSLEDRPVLAQAVQIAKAEGAVILVSKLDRLSRDVEVIAGLVKRAPFTVVSMPTADAFQLHLFAALAAQEKTFIGHRTKAALAVAKARGVQLGGLRPQTETRNKVVAQEADAFAAKVAAVALPLHQAGQSLRQIGAALTAAGILTARGKPWSAQAVANVLARVEQQAAETAQATA